MLSPPSSPLGKLLSRYVRARITRMDGIDIGLFDFDRHNTLYYFVLNAEEQIYLRYGGRNAESPTAYLDLESLALALETGLELHAEWQAGRLPAAPRPEPFFPREIESLRRYVSERGRCVECHLIADYHAQDLEREGRLDKLETMFASPEIESLGIHLDVPRGLFVASATGSAAAAGLRAGDRIVALEGTPVHTIGDLQYRYDQVPRVSSEITLTVEREGERLPLRLELPEEWWASDLFFRYWTVEPHLLFASRKLEAAEKRELGLPEDGFACRVRFVEPRAAAMDLHRLVVGDVIAAVDEVERDPVTTSCELHLKLRHRAGDTVSLTVQRGEEVLELPLRTERRYFRKQPSRD